jgi:hypothetical protein
MFVTLKYIYQVNQNNEPHILAPDIRLIEITPL